jgi:hypothetical protein
LCTCLKAVVPGLVTVSDLEVECTMGSRFAALLACWFSAVSSEMALAEANRFIAGCQQFCNIEGAWRRLTCWMVTGVKKVVDSAP